MFEMGAAVDPRSFLLRATGQAGDRLVLDLYDRRARPPAARKSVSQGGQRNIVIAIDAGHGGEDPGAIGPGRHVITSYSIHYTKLYEWVPTLRALLRCQLEYLIRSGAGPEGRDGC